MKMLSLSRFASYTKIVQFLNQLCLYLLHQMTTVITMDA